MDARFIAALRRRLEASKTMEKRPARSISTDCGSTSAGKREIITMAALLVIIGFVAFFALMNVIEFGSID